MANGIRSFFSGQKKHVHDRGGRQEYLPSPQPTTNEADKQNSRARCAEESQRCVSDSELLLRVVPC